MEYINLPIDTFGLILDIIKAEQYNITTLRQLARTCRYLNSTLQQDILNWQIKYHEPYTALECEYLLSLSVSTKCSYMNELVLDKLFSERQLNEYIVKGSLQDYTALWCSAAIGSNVELMEIMPIDISYSYTVARCVGYDGSLELFTYFKENEASYAFWFYCICGALIGDNARLFEFCHGQGMGQQIRTAIIVNKVGQMCQDWFVGHGYD